MDDFKKNYENIPIPENLDNVIDEAIEKAERKKALRFTKPVIAAACIAVITLGLNSSVINHSNLSNNSSAKNPATEEKILAAADITPLPSINSFDNLYNLIASSSLQQLGYGNYNLRTNDRFSTQKNTSVKSDSNSYSNTNNQVQGIDEGDIVQTDGQYIYSINLNKLIITKAYPADSMEVVQNIDLPKNFYPSELFVDDKHLVLVGDSLLQQNPYMDDGTMKQYLPQDLTYSNVFSTKIIVYDISNKKAVKELKTLEASGKYISARKIDSKLYLVSSQYVYKELLRNNATPYSFPFYNNDCKNNNLIYKDLNDIKYFPDSMSNSFINVCSLDLNNIESSFNVASYLGSANNIYVSENNLYVSGIGRDKTSIYKFSLYNGNPKYLGKADIDGTILNQFSMDEYNGNFRITTTKKDTVPKNNIYILDKNMNTIGKIEDLAQGELIYSTRFMGDRAYMVTFKLTDPLFVIDLKTPSSPKVLGELKIPGFSNYLEPYDENHIIGFGKDAVEANGTAYHQGMKVALFDVSDVNNPKVQFSTTIGDRGTDSELLRNHKALLFSKEKNLLAFPVNVAKLKDQIKNSDVHAYGNIVFSGAYVYSIDPEKGFILKGQITHDEANNNKTSDKNMGYNFSTQVNRILYINNTLYTVSNSSIKANDLSSMKELKSVKLPQSKN